MSLVVFLAEPELSPIRTTAALAMTEVSVVRVEKQTMIGLLHDR